MTGKNTNLKVDGKEEILLNAVILIETMKIKNIWIKKVL